MKSTTLKYLMLAVCTIISLCFLQAQQKTIVVTRTIEKSFEIKTRRLINIQTEKGKVYFIQSADDFVRIRLRLVAKHPDEKIAKKELGFFKYSMSQVRGEVILYNSILMDTDSREIKSILFAEYYIEIPRNMAVLIFNNFGLVSFNNVEARVNGELNYSDLNVEGMKGSIRLTINKGDFSCNNSNLKVKLTTNFSEIQVDNLRGEINLTSKYGSTNIILNPNLEVLLINSTKTDLSLYNRSCDEYSLSIESQNAPIRFSENCYIKKPKVLIKEGGASMHDPLKTINYVPQIILPKIEVQAKYGSVNLN